jgi:dihydrolipoamide dehydrogenase
MLPGILPGVDSDVRKIVHSALVKSGVKIHVSSRAVSAARGEGSARVVLEDGTEVVGSVLVVAAGRVPNTADLGLTGSGVAFTPKGITTDDRMMTSVEGIYAAGDVTGRWQLAHAGSAQALLAVDSMFRPGHRALAPDAMPGCIFTSPEVATVGPGEDEWRQRGVPVRVEYARYIANGRAVGLNETEGFVKLVARESDGVLVGVQIVGRDASSLVGEASLAVTLGIRASALGQVVHPHPTLSELFMEAGEAFGDGSIHG